VQPCRTPPPSIHLYVARHGRTSWNELGRFQGITDVSLDDFGRAQAAALARVLAGKIEAVITSDLRRASESGDIIASALGIPLLAHDADLRERGYGVFEGLTRDECKARHPGAWAARKADRNFEPPGGELRSAVVTRMQRGLARAVDALHARHERALIIGHGSSLRMFLEALTSAPVASIGNLEYRELRHDQHGFRLVVPPELSRAKADHCPPAGGTTHD